jgi:hypothetical protein
MARIFEHRWPRTYFDETAQIHNPNVVRYALDDRNIVTDEEEGQSQVKGGRLLGVSTLSGACVLCVLVWHLMG